MILSPADFIQIERDLGRRSFKHFVRMAWHVVEPAQPLAWGWALEAMADHLQAISEGKFNRLLMNVPPGMMKSLMMNVFWPAWEWIDKPYLRYLSTAHKQDLAVRDNLKCRRLITSEWYRMRWQSVTLTTDQNVKTKFENDRTGFREAMAFTSLTGSRGDRVLLDDPLSVDDAHSDAAIKAVDTTFREALPTRVNNDSSAIVVTMQRLNEKDPSGIILSEDLGYVHLCLPMEFEPDRRCVTPIFTDPRTVAGELLFPERFTPEALPMLKKTLGSYGVAGQLQQRPSPAGGGIFKSEWWRYLSVAPRLQWRVVYGDTAQKDKEQNDYSVFECWGKTFDGQIILLDVLRGKWQAPELLVNARAFWAKHKAIDNGTLRQMKIEDKSSGTGLIQQLQRGDREKGHEPIPVAGIPRDRDKVSRAYDTTPHIEAGNVILLSGASWLSDYLAEFAAFPNGAHDDMIDPTMDAVAEMLGKVTNDFSGIM